MVGAERVRAQMRVLVDLATALRLEEWRTCWDSRRTKPRSDRLRTGGLERRSRSTVGHVDRTEDDSRQSHSLVPPVDRRVRRKTWALGLKKNLAHAVWVKAMVSTSNGTHDEC